MNKSFKIKPNPNLPYYFEVKYFNTNKSMVRYCKQFYPAMPSYRVLFDFHTYKNRLGIIYLCKKYANIPYISHECNHATFHYFRILGIKFCEKFHDNPGVEEKFCYVQQSLVSQILERISPSNVIIKHFSDYNKGNKYYTFPKIEINQSILDTIKSYTKKT